MSNLLLALEQAEQNAAELPAAGGENTVGDVTEAEMVVDSTGAPLDTSSTLDAAMVDIDQDEAVQEKAENEVEAVEASADTLDELADVAEDSTGPVEPESENDDDNDDGDTAAPEPQGEAPAEPEQSDDAEKDAPKTGLTTMESYFVGVTADHAMRVIGVTVPTTPSVERHGNRLERSVQTVHKLRQTSTKLRRVSTAYSEEGFVDGASDLFNRIKNWFTTVGPTINQCNSLLKKAEDKQITVKVSGTKLKRLPELNGKLADGPTLIAYMKDSTELFEKCTNKSVMDGSFREALAAHREKYGEGLNFAQVRNKGDLTLSGNPKEIVEASLVAARELDQVIRRIDLLRGIYNGVMNKSSLKDKAIGAVFIYQLPRIMHLMVLVQVHRANAYASHLIKYGKNQVGE